MSAQTVDLVRAAKEGDADAYGALVRHYTGFVYSMALRMLGGHHAAEDLCQDVFVTGWVKLKKLAEPEAFPGWISTIARRACLSAIDKRSKKCELGEEEAVLKNQQPTLPASFDRSRQILEQAVAKLPLRDRELLTLCYFEELTSSEVAEVLGIPPGTVRVALHRARCKLKKLLEEKQDDLMG